MNGACCILACPAQQTRLVAARLKSLNSAVAARTPPGLKHFRRAKTWAYLTVLYKYLHSLAPFRYKRGKTIPTAYKGSSTSKSKSHTVENAYVSYTAHMFFPHPTSFWIQTLRLMIMLRTVSGSGKAEPLIGYGRAISLASCSFSKSFRSQAGTRNQPGKESGSVPSCAK